MKPGKTAMTALIAVGVLSGTALAAPTALAARTGAMSPAFTNPGAVSPSLSLSVSPAGEPEVASVGPAGSLWFRFMTGGVWHKTRVGGPGSAFSGPSLFAGPLGTAGIAVEGAAHTLQFYGLAAGHWHHFIVARGGSTYSAPSLAVAGRKAAIAVEGPHHSLMYYSGTPGHLHRRILNSTATFSAPSMLIRAADQATHSNPAGEADIAAEGPGHTVFYYRILPNGHDRITVIAPGMAFSAPSLVVVTSAFPTNVGDPYLMVQGPHHSMVAFTNAHGWETISVAGRGRAFSAPSLTLGDTTRNAGVAFQGAGNSVSFYYFSTSSNHWVNDVISSATGTVDSAPALFFRTANPAGENDLVFQGSGNTLWYFSAPGPGSPNLAPSFTRSEIAGHGTTFGG